MVHLLLRTQVAKNLLLSNELSLNRKIKEAILAIRLEKTFDKDTILELYLNEIYLGQGTYGVVAASLKYFNKSLDELDLHEVAYLAALPKAPNNYHPIKNREKALERRNWVLQRMLNEFHINKEQYEEAQKKPLDVILKNQYIDHVPKGYFIDEVLQEIAQKAPSFDVNKGGFSVRTTMDTTMQKMAFSALQKGLIEYDERHDYIKPSYSVKNIEAINHETLNDIVQNNTIYKGKLAHWQYAIVTDVDHEHIMILDEQNQSQAITKAQLPWSYYRDSVTASERYTITDLKNIFRKGDIILIEHITNDNEPRIIIRQIPEVNGAIVVIHPYTGRVQALVGGFDYMISKFNRATQAKRQPGSAIKPFVYYCALEHQAISPLEQILDAPVVIDQGENLGLWKPKNYGKGYNFYGLQPVRVGLEKSRNLMTLRIAQKTGMEKIKKCIEKTKMVDTLPPYLSASLGSIELNLLSITNAYTAFVNGGRLTSPTFVDRLQDREGKTLYKSDYRLCQNCTKAKPKTISMPHIISQKNTIMNEDYAYIINDMLQGVVKYGTAQTLRNLSQPLGGKTGTTNDNFDSWFIGYSPDIVVGVYVGFDMPRSLGVAETGSSVALPIFKEFMQKYLARKKPIPFRTPKNITIIKMNKDTWQPVSYESDSFINQPVTPELWQAYKGQESDQNPTLEGVY